MDGRWSYEGISTLPPKGTPASVKIYGGDRVKLRSSCEMVSEESIQYDTFWDLLEECGGGWMWEHVSQETRNQDFEWLETGMREGTLVWCVDGSYKRKTAPDVCGVGWVVECTKTGKRLEGFFYEISEDANAYRAEQLGTCAICHLITALSLFFKILKWKTRAVFDSEGTIKISRRRLK